jgi:hypothetical protein
MPRPNLTEFRICGEAELNFALLELVKNLGHPHPIVCGIAFHEVWLVRHFVPANSIIVTTFGSRPRSHSYDNVCPFLEKHCSSGCQGYS